MDQGLSSAEVKKLQQNGPNTLYDESDRNHAVAAFFARFKNPLVIILLFAASLSLFFGDKASFFIITAIILLSVGLDFLNTFRSQRAAEALKDKVKTKASALRDGKRQQVDVSELVVGDVVILSAGKVVPADGVVTASVDLFANEAALTGESFPQGKPVGAEVYMGSGIISGSGTMRVREIGKATKFAHIAQALQSAHRTTEFERELKDFSVLIIKLTFLMVVFVLVVNILFHRDILESVLFSLALAVGLTPELLPLIITLNLSKGSLKMARQGVIVKQLSAVQNFGSMDVLCTDKTGTLTEDKIALVKYVDGKNDESDHVLLFGYLASAFSTSFENPLDAAVTARSDVDISMYRKIDEIPFDFERKREAVVVHHVHEERRTLIVKGAPEEVLKISAAYGVNRSPLTDDLTATIQETYTSLSRTGFRVLAVASKIIGSEKHYHPDDESALSFLGFLAFLDPAKASVSDTLERMKNMGISIKIITGDNAFVTQKIADDIGLAVENSLTGDDLAKLSPPELIAAVENTTIFARVNPEQKMQIIRGAASQQTRRGLYGRRH